MSDDKHADRCFDLGFEAGKQLGDVRIAALEVALKDADDALTEAEAILGGEYGDHHATLCETMLKLRGRIAALGACQ